MGRPALFPSRPGAVAGGRGAKYRDAPSRGADTDRFDLAQQSAGLWAISAGLSHNYKYDVEMLETGMKIYDALYSWAKFEQTEKHT